MKDFKLDDEEQELLDSIESGEWQSVANLADENIGAKWINLANKRYNELKDGSVKPISWDDITKEVRS